MFSLPSSVYATAIVALTVAYAKNLSWQFGASTKEDLEFEILKKLEIQKMKSKILQHLGMEEPPTFRNSAFSLSNDAIRMLIETTAPEPPMQQQNDFAKVLIFPTNNDLQCHWHNDSSCRRFEFKMSPDTVPSSTEFCVRKLKSHPSQKTNISVLCSPPRIMKQKVFEPELLDKSDKKKWLFFPIAMPEDWKFWAENVVCSLEITGITIDERKGNSPFLKMEKDVRSRIRKKKTEGSTTNHCVRKPFNVSFEEMGFGDWVIHPPSYEAYICQGYCIHTQNHHETFMDILFLRNKTLEAEFGRCWSTCCRPKDYGSLSMIYREDDNKITTHNMTKMIVLSCACS